MKVILVHTRSLVWLYRICPEDRNRARCDRWYVSYLCIHYFVPLNGCLAQSYPSRRREDSSELYGLMPTTANTGEEAEKESERGSSCREHPARHQGLQEEFPGDWRGPGRLMELRSPCAGCNPAQEQGPAYKDLYLICLFLFFTILKITFLICEFLTLCV